MQQSKELPHIQAAIEPEPKAIRVAKVSTPKQIKSAKPKPVVTTPRQATTTASKPQLTQVHKPIEPTAKMAITHTERAKPIPPSKSTVYEPTAAHVDHPAHEPAAHEPIDEAQIEPRLEAILYEMWHEDPEGFFELPEPYENTPESGPIDLEATTNSEPSLKNELAATLHERLMHIPEEEITEIFKIVNELSSLIHDVVELQTETSINTEEHIQIHELCVQLFTKLGIKHDEGTITKFMHTLLGEAPLLADPHKHENLLDIVRQGTHERRYGYYTHVLQTINKLFKHFSPAIVLGKLALSLSAR